MKKGATFESYVHFVYDAILNLRGEKIQVSRNTVFRIKEGESYEIDIYYEFVHAGVRHRVAVECKDWHRPVDQGQVLLFHQKIKKHRRRGGRRLRVAGGVPVRRGQGRRAAWDIDLDGRGPSIAGADRR